MTFIPSTTDENSRQKWTGTLLRNLRKKSGWSQSMLAERVSNITNIPLGKSAVSKWERARDNSFRIESWNLKALNSIFYNEGKESYELFSKYISEFGHLEEKISVSGRYQSVWEYDNKKNPEILELTKHGKIIIGRIEKGDIDYELYGYLFSGRILTGIWINKYDSHHGTVMLEFDFDFQKAYGNWIGTSDKNKNKQDEKFKYGKWSIKKIE